MNKKLEETIKVKDLQEFFKNKSKYRINKTTGHTGILDTSYDGGSQGEYNEYFIFYKHPNFPANIFFRETYHTDSYGSNDSLVNVDLVEGVAKTITVYEPIK
jgi:hypothetical protein